MHPIGERCLLPARQKLIALFISQSKLVRKLLNNIANTMFLSITCDAEHRQH